MSERDKLTTERILAIARSKGVFEVSWRYRDDWLRERCARMVKAGLLYRIRGKPGRNYYRAIEPLPEVAERAADARAG